MYDNKLIQKGPSVDDVRLRKADGKVKATDVLAFQPGGLTVEEAREAMLAAGEAPRGSKLEAKPAAPRTDPELKNRWDRAIDKKNGVKEFSSASEKWNRRSDPGQGQKPSTTVKVDLPAREEAPVTSPTSFDGGYLIRFTYPNGEQETIEAANRVQMIREVKRRQAWLMSKGVSAEVEIAEIGTDGETVESVKTDIGAGAPEPKISADGSKIEAEPAQRGTGGPSSPERLETSKFVLDVAQEDGQWVAKVSYKNGSGTEAFYADSRKALLMKVLEGKAHATLKVREVLRRDQYHDDLDKVYDIPGYSQESFEALTPESQALVIDSIAAKAAIEFIHTTPEFFGNATNKDMLLTFLHKRNLPITVTNLKYAFAELADDLEQRPQTKVSVPETPAPAVATVAADSAPTTAAAPTAASAAPTPAAAPTTEVRKRGSFGFKPGFTSLAPSEFEESTASGKKTNELSEKEARSIPLEELAKQVRSKYNRNRQF